jgi:hypothetical protein
MGLRWLKRKSAGPNPLAMAKFHLQQDGLSTSPLTERDYSTPRRKQLFQRPGCKTQVPPSCKYIRKKSQSRFDFGSIVGSRRAEP